MKLGAMSFNYSYYKTDIDSFYLYFEKNNEEIKSSGFLTLLYSLSKENENEKIVIYVKNLPVFYILSRNFICYEDAKGTYSRDKGNKIFWLRINNIEFRNWDNFLPHGVEIDQPKAFLCYLRGLMKWFGGGIEQWNYTLANRVKSYLNSHYYLYNEKDYKNRHKINEQEYTLYSRIKKGGFYWSNPRYNNEIVNDIFQFDASSNHISQMARKKFPYESLHLIRYEQFREIFNDDNWCWAAEISFSKYEKLTELDFDLFSYGMEYDRKTKRYSFCFVNPMKVIFKLFKFEDLKFEVILAAKASYLPNNYYSMIKDLYKNKEEAKSKDYITSSITKFITELPYGLSIRNWEYSWDYIFSEEKNDFVKVKHDFDFEEITRNLERQPLPIHLGIWTLAYSNSELINLILKVGPEYVVYCDTDCIKFKLEKNVEIIKQHNETINKEFETINKEKQFVFQEKLGRWKDEGLAVTFKAIGVKWYLTRDTKRNLKVKAAGADTKILQDYLNKSSNPFKEFNTNLSIDNLFCNYIINKEKGWIEGKDYKDVYDYLKNN